MNTGNASPGVAWLQGDGNWGREKPVSQQSLFLVIVVCSCGQKRGGPEGVCRPSPLYLGNSWWIPSYSSQYCPTGWGVPCFLELVVGGGAHCLRGRGRSQECLISVGNTLVAATSALSRYPKCAEQLLICTHFDCSLPSS